VSVIGSSLGEATLDLSVLGSSVLGDGATSLTAGRDVTIAAATDTLSTTAHRSVKVKGLMTSNGGFGVTYGERSTTTDNKQDATTQSGQARSQVGSIGGDLTVKAGNAIKISGADVAAGHDLALAGQSVTVDPGLDASSGEFKHKMTQDGLTLAVGGSVVTAVQAVQSLNEAKKAKNSRVTAMAAASAAIAVSNAVNEASQGFSVSLSLTAGHSESEQIRTTADKVHVGSTLAAGNNISISAAGAGKDSNINIVGSDLKAANNVALKAGNQVNLVAAQDTESQHSKSESMSAAAGIAASYSSGKGGGGMAVGVTGSVSASRGHEDGEGVTQIDSHVTAGRQVSLVSGGDTNVKGAVVSGAQVVGDVKGNLNLESLQDKATFDSSSLSASATVGYGASYSGSLSMTKINSDYASVYEQSAIKAGDQGFQIKVGGNTSLTGAVIASTAAGAASSSLDTGTLTSSDIANHSVMKATSIGLSGSVTTSGSAGEDAKGKDGGTPGGDANAKHAGPGGTTLMNMGKSGTNASLPVVVAASDSDASTTRSGVGAGALVIRDNAGQIAATGKSADETVAATNRKVETGTDTSGKIANNFDLDKVQTTLDVTAAFASTAAAAIGDYATKKMNEANALKVAAASETDPQKKAELYQQSADMEANWKEDGAARVALHTVVGGLGGGLNGALGAGATALSAPVISDQIDKLDVPKEVKSALTLAAGAAVGAAAGGTAGAAAATNEVANNFLTHKNAVAMQKDFDQCKKQPGGCTDYDYVQIRDKYLALSKNNIAVVQACVVKGDAACVADLEKQAASVGEITGVVSADFTVFAGRQTNILTYGSVNGSASLFGTDVQQANEVAAFRKTSCTGISAKDCDTVVKDALAYRKTRVLLLTAAGAAVPLVVRGVRAIGKGPATNLQPVTVEGENTAMPSSSHALVGDEPYGGSGAMDHPVKPSSPTGLKAASGDLTAAANAGRNQPYGNGASASPSPGIDSAGSTGRLIQMPEAGANSTIRETGLANIEATRVGNASSNFATFAGRESLVNEALAANQSPWPFGYTPSVRPMAVGEKFNMVIDANQAQGLRGPGGFGTFSDIPNQPFARDTLAITEQFKSDISFLQRYEVVQPFSAIEGPIGPQIDQVTGRLLQGSKTTWQLDLQLPWNQRTQYLKPIGKPVPLTK
jgi:hypothetical protein